MQDECGAITIFVLIFSVLLLVAGGMAVDFQRQELARADLQNALDRGILAATNDYQTYESSGPLSVDEQAEQLIYEYMASRNYKPTALNLDVAVTQTTGGRSIVASADERIDTIFLRMMGLDTLNVAVRSGALQAAPKLEITLVLDVSGSMGWESTSAPGTKVAQLKIAAKEFLDIVLSADSAAQTLITIVPFSQQVALPRSMADLYNLDRVHDFSSCFDYHGLDFTTTAMSTNTATPFEQGQHFIENVGVGNFGCPKVNNAITPLSNDVNMLKNAIDALSPETWTATYMGMKWGSALLDPTSRPVVDAMIANNELSVDFAGWPHAWNDTSVRKITVLMSDGQNTKLNEIVDGTKVAIIDNETRGDGDPILADICAAAKIGANATIYTIGFELADQPLATAALENCASSLSTHYLVEGVEISTAFRNIADEIVTLKLIN
jgi:Flp pilus assembly protein TadG